MVEALVSVRLFSRRNGWPGGRPIGVYHTPEFYITFDMYRQCEDKKGKHVFQVLKTNGMDVPEEIRAFGDWHCYESGTEFYASDTL